MLSDLGERIGVPATIRDEVRSLKRDKILDVAAQLFSERGYHGTSIDAICGELGVTKPFIYYHFERKDDILQALYQSSIDTAIGVIEEARASDESPLRQLSRFVVAYNELVTSDYQPRIALNSREKGLLSREMMRQINNSKYQFVSSLVEILKAGTEAGEFEIENYQVTAQAILGILHWTINWYRPEGTLSTSELSDILLRLVLRVVGARSEAVID